MHTQDAAGIGLTEMRYHAGFRCALLSVNFAVSSSSLVAIVQWPVWPGQLSQIPVNGIT
jgi:hypothetical protein